MRTRASVFGFLKTIKPEGGGSDLKKAAVHLVLFVNVPEYETTPIR